MRQIIVILFCGCLSAGNLQGISNENDYQYQPVPAMVQVQEEHIWPVHTLQTFQGNFYGTARKTIKAKPCVRQSISHDVNSHENGQMSVEQLTNHQLVTPTRRSSILETLKKLKTNKESLSYLKPQIVQNGETTTLSIQTQTLKDRDLNTYKSQSQTEELNYLETHPQVLKKENLPKILNEGSRTMIMKTEIENSEELNRVPQDLQDQVTNNYQMEKNKEMNVIGLKPQVYTDSQSSIIKTRSQTSKNKELIPFKKQLFKNEESSTFKIKTKVLQEEELDTVKTEPQNSNKLMYETNTFIIHPSAPKQESLSTVAKQYLTNKDVNLQTSSSDSRYIQNAAFNNNNEKMISENTISISSENVMVPENQIFKTNKIKSYNFEGSADHLGNSLPIDSTTLVTQSKVHCADDKYVPASEPLVQKRILLKSLKNEGKLSAFGQTGIPESNNSNRNAKYIFEDIKGTNTGNKALDISTQNINYLHINTETNLNDDKSNEHEASLEKSPANDYKIRERSGKMHFVLSPGVNGVKDPTQGEGISNIQQSKLMMMDYDRVCYACTTATSQSCLAPSRRTAVKYCRKGDNACVTKTFTNGNNVTTVRDCAKSCDDPSVLASSPKYKTCGVCYSDLCNNAYSIKVHTLILTLPSLVTIVLVKPLL